MNKFKTFLQDVAMIILGMICIPLVLIVLILIYELYLMGA